MKRDVKVRLAFYTMIAPVLGKGSGKDGEGGGGRKGGRGGGFWEVCVRHEKGVGKLARRSIASVNPLPSLHTPTTTTPMITPPFCFL